MRYEEFCKLQDLSQERDAGFMAGHLAKDSIRRNKVRGRSYLHVSPQSHI